MRVFEVSVNEKRAFSAGIQGVGSLHASLAGLSTDGVNWATILSVNGFNRSGQSLAWPSLPLNVGDCICIRVQDADYSDPPLRSSNFLEAEGGTGSIAES